MQLNYPKPDKAGERAPQPHTPRPCVEPLVKFGRWGIITDNLRLSRYDRDPTRSMSNSDDLYSLPPAVVRASKALRRAGAIGFWVQMVLGVVAGLIFLFAIPAAATSQNAAGTSVSAEQGPGIFFSLTSIVALLISIYWSNRYMKFGKRLATTDGERRPKRSETNQLIERGLIINLVGIFFGLLGAETITGILLAKALQAQGVAFTSVALSQLIQPLDIFVVLGNTHTIVAHFAGLLASLWLLKWINRSPSG